MKRVFHILVFDCMDILYFLLQKWIPCQKLSEFDIQQYHSVLVDLIQNDMIEGILYFNEKYICSIQKLKLCCLVSITLNFWQESHL